LRAAGLEENQGRSPARVPGLASCAGRRAGVKLHHRLMMELIG